MISNQHTSIKGKYRVAIEHIAMATQICKMRQTEKMEPSILSVALTNYVAIAKRPTATMPFLPDMKAH